MKAIRASILCILLFLPAVLSGQGKFYTRKARLEDFTTKTTKVVTSGQSPLELALRAEVTSRWNLSPYESCTPEEYESIKDDSNYYFLRFGAEDGIAFLLLEKGGKPDDSNRFDRAFEVLRIPIATLGAAGGEDIVFLGAIVDIIQDFTKRAMESDKSGLFGLELSNTRNLKGKSVYLDADMAGEALNSYAPGVLVPLCIAPAQGGEWCYKMLIDTESHELMFFNKLRYKSVGDEKISDRELSNFKARHAIIVR